MEKCFDCEVPDVSDQSIVTYCAPTLAGIKTANLFSCPAESRTDLEADLERAGEELIEKGICIRLLGIVNGRALIYVYRPDFLKRDLSRREVRRLLRSLGYPVEDPDDCLQQLMGNLGNRGTFPHEIGLFLGIPAEDVRGFIRNQAGNYAYAGYWKVYGGGDRQKKAEKLFRMYQNCTDCYERQMRCGKTLSDLAVKITDRRS